MVKRSFSTAFNFKPIKHVQVGDFYVEHTVYKVNKQSTEPYYFDIITSQNSKFQYGESTIKETSTSATLFTSVKKVTKTELIELFSKLTLNDIWFATYFTQDKNKNWTEELVAKIQSLEKSEAVKFLKKDFTTLGKMLREIAGQKILSQSDNNYYLVRDLNIYFDELNTSGVVETAAKSSIRQLDVNTLQSLIFNSVKYILK